jgi:hypothetical protein
LFNIAQERIGGFDVPLIVISGILIFAAMLWGVLESRVTSQ